MYADKESRAGPRSGQRPGERRSHARGRAVGRERITSGRPGHLVEEVGPCPSPISATRSICRQGGSATGRRARASPVVFVHGYLVDGRLWDGVVDRLSATHRCLAPDWPIGAQQIPMRPEADLTPYGIADRSRASSRRSTSNDVTIVGNDSGGAMSQVLVTRHPERIGRLVLTNCDTYENFPPGIFKAMPKVAALPGGMTMLSAPFRIGALARAAFRPFTETPLPADLIASWMRPGLDNPGVKDDVSKVTRRDGQALHARGGGEAAGLRLADPARLGARRPALPDQGAERLASDAGNARIVEIPDAKTFVPVDQPQRVAEEIAAFAAPHRKENATCGVFGAAPFFSSDRGCILCDARHTKDGEPCPTRSSTRSAPAARWPDASTKRSPGVRSGPPHRRIQTPQRTGPCAVAGRALADDRPGRRCAAARAARRLAQRFSGTGRSPLAASSSRILGSAAAVRAHEPGAL